MEKTFMITCHNCKEEFPIRVTLKPATRSGGTQEETITKTCPSCGTENKIILPKDDNLGNTGTNLRGGNPNE